MMPKFLPMVNLAQVERAVVTFARITKPAIGDS
jgi:hypothetical protein